jgi:hypothetical protein
MQHMFHFLNKRIICFVPAVTGRGPCRRPRIRSRSGTCASRIGSAGRALIRIKSLPPAQHNPAPRAEGGDLPNSGSTAILETL